MRNPKKEHEVHDDRGSARPDAGDRQPGGGLTTSGLRLVIKSDVQGNPFAAIAELDVLAK